MPILKYGAPELKALNKPVDCFNGELEKIAKNMIETMYAASGVGLAAPQVGINICLTTVDISVGEDAGRLVAICNPEIVSAEGEQKNEEGCLSIPDFTGSIVRPSKITLRGHDLHGAEMTIEAVGLMARCLSHEIDHLHGILFIDRLSALKRSLIKNKIKKLAKSCEW